MIRKGLVFLVVFSLPVLASDRWREMKSEGLAKRAQLRVAAMASTKTINVDCTKGDSVQDAIDKNGGAIVIEIRGICTENVRVEDRDVTLHGLNPANDGLASASVTPALTFVDSNNSRVENLSLSDNPGTALVLGHSVVVLVNVIADNNNGMSGPGATAIIAGIDSFVDATNLTMSNNQRNALTVQRGANFFCHGCDFTNNSGWAATSTRGAIVSLLRSTVTQRFGIRTNIDSYADIDCISEVSAHPCSMQATGRAAQAFGGGVTYMYGAGDFTGQVEAFDRGVIGIYGARQLATGQPGQGPSRNVIGDFSMLYVNAAFDVTPHLTSRVMGTDASRFARMLITDDSEVAGTIVCGSAADAWLDPGVVGAPGASVSGCEHGTL